MTTSDSVTHTLLSFTYAFIESFTVNDAMTIANYDAVIASMIRARSLPNGYDGVSSSNFSPTLESINTTYTPIDPTQQDSLNGTFSIVNPTLSLSLRNGHTINDTSKWFVVDPAINEVILTQGFDRKGVVGFTITLPVVYPTIGGQDLFTCPDQGGVTAFDFCFDIDNTTSSRLVQWDGGRKL